jgi:hypothetical protein
LQRANVIVRLGGSLTNTVPKLGVTPAEILVLARIHGEDAVVDIRPTGFDKKRSATKQEYERLARLTTAAGGFTDAPGQRRRPQVAHVALFPGAMKRLPVTLEEIGIDRP